MSSVKAKKVGIVFWRALKIVSYLCGFLLLFHLVKKDSASLGGFFFGTASANAWKHILYMWLAVIAVQIICGLIFKKTIVKMIIVSAVACAITCAPLVYCRVVIEDKVYPEVEAAYEEKGYQDDFVSYNDTVYDYSSMANKLNNRMSSFLDYYNIDYSSTVYGGENTDMSDYYYVPVGATELPKEIEADYVFGWEKGDASYSKNGMYADGYLFGYTQARYILETYYNTQQKYKAQGKNADAELSKVVTELQTNPNSAWNKYKRTSAYTNYYGSDLDNVENAKRYYISEERLDGILGAIGEAFGETKSAKKSIDTALGMASFLGLNINVSEYLNKDLSLDQIITLLQGFGLDVQKSDIMSLVEGYSYYISPSTYPVYYFIDDTELRDYAYAKYYGEVHGAAVGSVLIGDRVGEVNLSSDGNPAEDIGKRLASLERMDYDATWMPEYLGWFILRERLLYFTGIVTFTIMASYFFAAMEKRAFRKMIKGVKEGTVTCKCKECNCKDGGKKA